METGGLRIAHVIIAPVVENRHEHVKYLIHSDVIRKAAVFQWLLLKGEISNLPEYEQHHV